MSCKTIANQIWLLVILLLAACGTEPVPPTQAPPDTEAIPDWTPTGETQVFVTENLYDLVDGQAEAFFAYAFEQVTVETYEDKEGKTLRVEVWQVATPADAYGLFTTYRAGTPAAIGNEGDTDSERRLDFWQDRYFVRLFAPQPLPDAVLQALAEMISGTLPAGGERPVLVDRLPQEGRVERSDIFFHEEISIQSYLWLGGENLLGLDLDTDGVLAPYEVGDGIAHLLLVQYPDTTAASTALASLQAAQPDGLITAQTREDLLGAVFGMANEAEASALLAAAFSE